MTKKTVLALITGSALVFAFPPFNAGLIAWVALIPLFAALEGESKWRGAALGFISGFAFHLGAVYWVVHSMANYGGVPFATSILIMLMLVVYMSLYWAVFGFFYAHTARLDGIARVAIIPALWVALEFARGHLFTGFPWVLLGYTQAGYLPVIQIADITGVWGISFAIIAVNASLAFVAAFLKGKKEGKVPLIPVALTGFIAASIISYGAVRIKMVDSDVRGWSAIKAAVAQGSIDQGMKWDGRYQRTTIDIYGELTEKASGSFAKLIVWPETALPFYYHPEQVQSGPVGELARKTGTYILTGSPSYNYNPGSDSARYYNSAYLINPAGETIGKYDKYHLVPFGEYVPLRGLLPVGKLTAGIGDFAEGPGPQPIRFEGGGIGTLICFESIFPEIARGHVRNGATLLVNITNDAWFGRTSAPYQHFQMSVLRAVENRSFLVRSANTGISGFIDPNGRVRKKTALFEKTEATDDVRLRQGPLTFYTQYGDMFAWGCNLMAGAFVAASLMRKKNR